MHRTNIYLTEEQERVLDALFSSVGAQAFNRGRSITRSVLPAVSAISPPDSRPVSLTAPPGGLPGRRARLGLDPAARPPAEHYGRASCRWPNQAIPGFLADMLTEQLAHRALPGSAGLVFPNRADKPIAASSFNTAHWKPAKHRAGIDGLRWHDLRHTAVALAIVQGAHPKAIQARLGHSSVQVTLDRYGHLFPELDAAIADGLEGTFRASLRLIPGGADEAPQTPARDTARTQMTRGRHKIAASEGHSRSPADKAKTGPDQGEHSEAASGIEPLYRVLQTL